MSSRNGTKSILRSVERVLTIVVAVLSAAVIAGYLAMMTALGLWNAAAGDTIGTVITFGVFVLPVVGIVLRRRLSAAYHARGDPDVDAATPAP